MYQDSISYSYLLSNIAIDVHATLAQSKLIRYLTF